MKTLSKNAQRQGAHKLTSRWGGVINMRSIFKNGRFTMKRYVQKPIIQPENLTC